MMKNTLLIFAFFLGFGVFAQSETAKVVDLAVSDRALKPSEAQTNQETFDADEYYRTQVQQPWVEEHPVWLFTGCMFYRLSEEAIAEMRKKPWPLCEGLPFIHT